MKPEDWRKLHEWLYRVFPATEAAAMFEEQVQAARALSKPLPPTDLR